ncbi:cytidine deaminase-like protein [Testicularia cyperi]|uniref:dCMP deaminase n=1 Tax=Testicularia cyperi TaxID=1882483 RepID=A0A317XQ91_9BASI|nr:cytidine deaminase-like protein [Testicularia cyperi]
MKRRVGAVLVAGNRILATGYNGTPSGLTNCNQGGCPRCNNTLALASTSTPTSSDLSSMQNGTPATTARAEHEASISTSTSTLPGMATAVTTAIQSSAGQNLEECLCLHAEENALLEAGRSKIPARPPSASSSARKAGDMGNVGNVGDVGDVGEGGATMYCNTCPCLRCAVKIIQTGIAHVVYQLEYNLDFRTKDIFRQAGVSVRQFHLD